MTFLIGFSTLLLIAYFGSLLGVGLLVCGGVLAAVATVALVAGLPDPRAGLSAERVGLGAGHPRRPFFFSMACRAGIAATATGKLTSCTTGLERGTGAAADRWPGVDRRAGTAGRAAAVRGRGRCAGATSWRAGRCAASAADRPARWAPSAITRADLRRLFADRSNLFFLVVLPLLIVFALGMAIGGTTDYRVGVVDDAPSQLSRPVLQRMRELSTVDQRVGSSGALRTTTWPGVGSSTPAGWPVTRTTPRLRYFNTGDTS
ncbi:MAG: hypothetical protein R2734_17720 [Nocardioides sp.]